MTDRHASEIDRLMALVERLQADAIRRKTEFVDVVAEWEKQRNRADAAEAEAGQLRQQLEAESVVYYAMRDEWDHLAGELESATASVVSLSGRVDALEARCEQQKRDHAETVAEVERLRAVEQRVRELQAAWREEARRANTRLAVERKHVDVAVRENAWVTACTNHADDLARALNGGAS